MAASVAVEDGWEFTWPILGVPTGPRFFFPQDVGARMGHGRTKLVPSRRQAVGKGHGVHPHPPSSALPPQRATRPPRSSLYTTVAAWWEERVLFLFLKPLCCVGTE